MKTNKFIIPLLVLGLVVAFSSCKDEKEEGVFEESMDRGSSDVQQEVFYHCNINSANDLVSFAQRVNSGEKNLNARLMCDIDVSKVKLVTIAPIVGNNSVLMDEKNALVFNGIFNGNGHTISGMTNSELKDNVALIGSLGTSGEVRDLKIASVSLDGHRGVAAICVASQGLIQHCEVVSGEISGSAAVAGVCAYNYGVVQDCVNRATIVGEESVGGLCAMNNMGLIDGCENAGEVVGQKSAIIGGLAAVNNNYIVNSKNNGKVRNGFSAEGTGGICGQNNAMVYNCFNEGVVEGGVSGVAGICGKLLGVTSAEVKNCISVGAVQPQKRENSGAVVGWLSGNCEVKTCYYDPESSILLDGLAEPASESVMCTSIRPYLNNWIKEEGTIYVPLQRGSKSVSLKDWKVVDRNLLF